VCGVVFDVVVVDINGGGRDGCGRGGGGGSSLEIIYECYFVPNPYEYTNFEIIALHTPTPTKTHTITRTHTRNVNCGPFSIQTRSSMLTATPEYVVW
jgi:hypothetical protein